MAEVKLSDEQLETIAGGDITISYGDKEKTYTSTSTVGDFLNDFPELKTKWPGLKNFTYITLAQACNLYGTDEEGLKKMIMDKLNS